MIINVRCILDRVSNYDQLDNDYITVNFLSKYIVDNYDLQRLETGVLVTNDKSPGTILYNGTFTNRMTYPYIIKDIYLNSTDGMSGGGSDHTIVFCINDNVVLRNINFMSMRYDILYSIVIYPGNSIKFEIKVESGTSGRSSTSNGYIDIRGFYNN